MSQCTVSLLLKVLDYPTWEGCSSCQKTEKEKGNYGHLCIASAQISQQYYKDHFATDGTSLLTATDLRLLIRTWFVTNSAWLVVC